MPNPRRRSGPDITSILAATYKPGTNYVHTLRCKACGTVVFVDNNEPQVLLDAMIKSVQLHLMLFHDLMGDFIKCSNPNCKPPPGASTYGFGGQ